LIPLDIHYQKMRIGLDLRPFLRQETGVGFYLKSMLFHLAAIDRENEYCLFSSSWKDRFDRAKLPPFARMTFRDARIPVRALNLMWYRMGRPALDVFFGRRLDLTHSATPLVLPTAGKKIVTVHDLFYLDFPDMAEGEARTDFVRRTRSSLLRADGVLTFAQYTKTQILTRFGIDEKKVRVVPHGLDPRFLEDVPAARLEEVRSRLSLPPEFLLSVGTLEPRKNLPKLIEALKSVHLSFRRIPLVLAGPEGRDGENIRRTAARLGLEEWVLFTGYLPQEDIRCLYLLASVLVFPSLSEGFGFPVIEAMAGGLPAAVSRTSAFPEVAGDAALYFDPDSPDEIAARIVEILDRASLRRELQEKGKKRAAGFRWEKAAADTLAFYRHVVGGGRL
jgi:glycosyltransferase involved in cell wall biosynthesis